MLPFASSPTPSSRLLRGRDALDRPDFVRIFASSQAAMMNDRPAAPGEQADLADREAVGGSPAGVGPPQLHGPRRTQRLIQGASLFCRQIGLRSQGGAAQWVGRGRDSCSLPGCRAAPPAQSREVG